MRDEGVRNEGMRDEGVRDESVQDEGGEGKLVGACNLTAQIGRPLFTLSWYFIHSLHEYI